MTDEGFLKNVATMDPVSSQDGVYVLSNNEGESLVYVDSESADVNMTLPKGSFIVSSVDEKTGVISKPMKIGSASGLGTVKHGIYWIRNSK